MPPHLGDTWYEIRAVGNTDGDRDGTSDRFTFQLDKALGPGSWTLHVGTEEFTVWGHSPSIGWGRLGGINLGWTAGQQVTLRLEKTS